MNDLLFVITKKGQILRLRITDNALRGIVTLFTSHKSEFENENVESTTYSPLYKLGENEIYTINYELPDTFANIPDNTAQMDVYDPEHEKIKTICLFHEGEYYFQNFMNNYVLKNHRIALIFSRETYEIFADANAFTLEDKVHAYFHNNMLYFHSFLEAKRIFDLSAYYTEATNQNIDEIIANPTFLGSDAEWLKNNADSEMRRLLSNIQLQTLENINLNKRGFKSLARKANIPEAVYSTGSIILPRNKKSCKAVLAFLNEDIFEGFFSTILYRANSKRLN